MANEQTEILTPEGVAGAEIAAWLSTHGGSGDSFNMEAWLATHAGNCPTFDFDAWYSTHKGVSNGNVI